MSTERLDEALIILNELRNEYQSCVKHAVKSLKQKYANQRKTLDAIGSMVKLSGADEETVAILHSRLHTVTVMTASLMLDKFDEIKSSLVHLITQELNESSDVLNGKSLISDNEVDQIISQLFTSDFDYQMECAVSALVERQRNHIAKSYNPSPDLLVSAIFDADEMFVSDIINQFEKTADNIFTDVVRLTLRDKQVKCMTISPCDVTTKAECWFVHGTDINLNNSFVTHGSGCKCVPLFYINSALEDVKAIKPADEMFELLPTHEAKAVLGDDLYAKWLKGDSLNVLLTVDEGNSKQA